MHRLTLLTFLLILAPLALVHAQPAIGPDVVRQTIERLVAKHGEDQAERIRLGVEQVARRWWTEDGDAKAFSAFCEANFLTSPEDLGETFRRLERVRWWKPKQSCRHGQRPHRVRSLDRCHQGCARSLS